MRLRHGRRRRADEDGGSPKGGDYLDTAAGYEREPKGIEFPLPKLFAKLGDEYDKRFGLKDEHLAHISAVNYSNAERNPNAQTRTWYMTEDHARSQDKFNSTIGGRIKVSDCSQVTEFTAKVAESANEKYVLPHTRSAIMDALKRARITDWTASPPPSTGGSATSKKGVTRLRRETDLIFEALAEDRELKNYLLLVRRSRSTKLPQELPRLTPLQSAEGDRRHRSPPGCATSQVAHSSRRSHGVGNCVHFGAIATFPSLSRSWGLEAAAGSRWGRG